MKTRLQDKLLKLTIYLLPFSAFSFQKAGYGLIQPALIPTLLVLGLSLFQYGVRTKKALGNQNSALAIIVFFGIAIFSIFISIGSPHFYSLTKSIGVLGSLVIFFTVYYTVSFINNHPKRSINFIKIFVKVALFVAATIILEFVFKLFTGHNLLYELLIRILDLLPYEKPEFTDDSLINRYKGIIVEPGDVGFLLLPALAFLLNNLLISGDSINQKQSKNLIYTVILIFAVFITQSTTNIFLMAVLIGSFFLARKQLQKKYNLKKIAIKILLPFLAVLTIVTFIFINYRDSLPEIISERVDSLVAFFNTGEYDNNTNLSVQVILNSYNAAIYSLRINPFLGVGLGNITFSYEQIAVANEIRTRLNQHDGYSMLLRLLSEVGIGGTLGFIYIFWSRLFQSQKFINYLKHLVQSALLTQSYKNLATQGRGIYLAAVTSLIYALANRPTYWNLVIPVLFGLCFKSNFVNYYQIESSSNNEQNINSDRVIEHQLF